MRRYLKLASVSPDLEAARAATDTNPTDGQIEAGNYAKGKVKLRGFTIAIENPKGSVRKGKDKGGRAWSLRLSNDYGYFLSSTACDGDHVDVFIGSDPENGAIWVIDQHVDGAYDEPKVIWGEPTEAAAKATYRANYSPGWDGIGHIEKMTEDGLKTWMAEGAPELGTPTKKQASELPALLAAKEHSDNKRYAPKAELIREMLVSHPDRWLIDSQEGRFVGLTHRPTGFRMHLPSSALPEGVEIEKAAALRMLRLRNALTGSPTPALTRPAR